MATAGFDPFYEERDTSGESLLYSDIKCSFPLLKQGALYRGTYRKRDTR